MAPQAKVPQGARVYAVGDIHGRSDLLDALHDSVSKDLERSPADNAMIIYLGDYVDRGVDSSGVLDRLCDAPLKGMSRVLLKGNHEAMLLRFLEEPETGAQWRRYGGLETLHSYGLDMARTVDGYRVLAERFAEALPARHLELLQSLQHSASVGDYFFCHAGVRPGVPLERQREADLLWIRDVFLASDESFGKVVVHGHTPAEEPEIRGNRIGIDTGAYATHLLTCLVLEGEERRFLTA
jgi:serine/threonine protein phosphatase 1